MVAIGTGHVMHLYNSLHAIPAEKIYTPPFFCKADVEEVFGLPKSIRRRCWERSPRAARPSWRATAWHTVWQWAQDCAKAWYCSIRLPAAGTTN